MNPKPDDALVEEVEISGHIIDSLILPKVLDAGSADGYGRNSCERSIRV